MKQFLQLAAGAALLGVAVLCGFGCWGVSATVQNERQLAGAGQDVAKQTAAAEGEATAAVQRVGALADAARDILADSRPRIAASLDRLNGAAANLDQASANLRDASAEIVRPCGGGAPCGTLADVNRTLGSIRLAAGQVTAASERERGQLDQANQQETTIALTAEGDLNRLGDAIDGVNGLVRNSDLTGSLKSLNTSLGAVSGMATDTQQALHKFLHPSWPKRVWGAVSGAGIAVAKFFVP